MRGNANARGAMPPIWSEKFFGELGRERFLTDGFHLRADDGGDEEDADQFDQNGRVQEEDEQSDKGTAVAAPEWDALFQDDQETYDGEEEKPELFHNQVDRTENGAWIVADVRAHLFDLRDNEDCGDRENDKGRQQE